MNIIDYFQVFAALAVALTIIFLAAVTGYLDQGDRAQRWQELLTAYTLLFLAIITAPL